MMVLEQDWAIKLKLGSLEAPCRLYARFDGEGYLEAMALLAAPEIRGQVADLGVYLGTWEAEESFDQELVQKILAPIGSTNYIEIRHTAIAKESEKLSLVCIVERLSSAELINPLPDESPDLVSELFVDVGGRTYEASALDTRDALGQVERQHGIQLMVCGHCNFGETPAGGNGDGRHGLFCLRNVEQPRSLRTAHWDEWIPHGAIPGVDAFHSCPCFRPMRLDKRFMTVEEYDRDGT